jgi:hypothetical protein
MSHPYGYGWARLPPQKKGNNNYNSNNHNHYNHRDEHNNHNNSNMTNRTHFNLDQYRIERKHQGSSQDEQGQKQQTNHNVTTKNNPKNKNTNESNNKKQKIMDVGVHDVVANVQTPRQEIDERVFLRNKLERHPLVPGRVNDLKLLDQKERLTVFLPNDIYFIMLPRQKLPTDWEEQQLAAVETTKTFIEKEHESSDSDSSGGPGYDRTKIYTNYLGKLPYCFPMTVGFNADPMVLGENTDFCFCPCSNPMKRYREFFYLEEIIEGHAAKCRFGHNGPAEFVQHLGSLAGSCEFHKITLEYLTTLYANYYGAGKRHIAFEKKGDPAFIKTTKLIERKVQR